MKSMQWAASVGRGVGLASFAMFAIIGCSDIPKPPEHPYQRFVLVPNAGQVKQGAPDGALALDTQTGQLCYTVGGPFTEGFPAMEMCANLVSHHP